MQKSFSQIILEYLGQGRQNLRAGKVLSEGFSRLRETMYPWDNRRSAKRVRMPDATVTLTEENGRMHAARLRDISLGGIFVKTQDLMDAGRSLAVDIIGEAGNRLRKDGVVLRQARTGMALQWRGDSSDVADFIGYRDESASIAY